MKFDEVIAQRKSVRSFKSKKVKLDHILEIIEAANQAPFASNLNNLKFIIIEEEKDIAKIARWCDQLWISEAQALILVVADEANMVNLHDERGRIYSRQQAGAAIENMLLKVTDIGLASCWVGAFDEREIKRFIGIPDGRNLEAVIPLGYEKGDEPRKPKKDLPGTVYWEKWERSRRAEFFREGRDKYSVNEGYS